ncbi:uncharacterized protein P174DRAFT_422642 [Aspergillus novofumigatus IBT 16806]|uniref:Uncharacterized protein n=1 Tax=Aspergillus novofumigatus (strain IBT 16806) TaxID=1392255 RepID=A0A2I1C1M7_ASPN1|nr:uncharacterized protein P174DRAFT_422642 [Aspergillus novofumigatus IBT 16806]PKX91481.1 hypothetical protein P174DRAFT_422642 [Aspergillus novofumigatus IBT 16806]
MSLRIRSLFDRKGVAEKKAAHANAVEVMDEIYDLTEEHCSFGTHIDTELLKSLKTDCRDLNLANHGTYLDSFLPVFFEPLPPEQLPPVDLRDAETKRNYEFTKKSIFDLGYEPDERFLRAELTPIVAAIITRLADPEYEDHSVIPVMVISLLGKRKVRILQAHNNREGIVIRKPGFIRLNSPEEATDNMDLLVRFIASNRVGDTADPKNFFGEKQPETPPTIPGPSGAGSSQEELPEEIPESMSRLSLTIARQGSVRVRNFLRDPSLHFESDPERRLFTRSDEQEVQVPSTSAPKEEGGHPITRSDEHELRRAPVSRDLDPQTPESLSYVPFL